MQNWTPSRSTRFHKSFASKHPHIFKAIRICVIVFGSCAALLVIQLLLGFLFRMLYQATNFSATVLQAIYSALSYLLAILVVLKVARIIQKEPVSKKHTLGLSGLPTWLDLGLAPIAFIIYVIFAAILTNLFSLFPWFDPSQPQDTGFNLFLAGIDRVIVFFILVVVAPIAEEILFRGFIYGKIKQVLFQTKTIPENQPQKNNTSKIDLPQKTNTSKIDLPQKTKPHRHEIVAIVIASLITSLAFALMHGQWNVAVNVFAMSIVLCALREITGTIYSGIILHMLKNAIAFVLLYIMNYAIIIT